MDLAEAQEGLVRYARNLVFTNISEGSADIYAAIITCLDRYGPVKINLPICNMHKEAGGIVIHTYPNIPVTANGRLYEDELERTIERNPRQWYNAGEGSIVRGQARLSLCRDISLTKLIAVMYPELAGNDVKECSRNILRGVIGDDMKVIITKDQNEMRAVYKDSRFGSCMEGKGYDGAGAKWKDADVYPVDWYSQCPGVSLMYSREGDDVTMRVILLEKDGCVYYNNIYGDATLAKKEIAKLGKHQEMNGYPNYDSPHAGAFSIVGKEKEGKFYAPNPSFDKFSKHNYVAFKDGVFYYSDTKEPGFVWVQMQSLAKGIIDNTYCEVTSCAYCDKRIIGAPTAADDGSKFCTMSCANRHLYYKAKDKNGATHLIKGEMYHDKFAALHFTNREACIANGGLPIIYGAGTEYTIPESYDDELLLTVSIGWHTVKHEGKRYKISDALYATMFAAKLMDNNNVITPTPRREKFKCVKLNELVIALD